MSPSVVPPEPYQVKASMHYYPRDAGPPPLKVIGERPKDGSAVTQVSKISFNNLIGPGSNIREESFSGSATREVVVTDVTGIEDRFSLDVHGFRFLTHPSVEKDFLDDPAIKAAYYDECKAIIKTATGASRVHVMSHLIRRPDPDRTAYSTISFAPVPAHIVHIDNTPDAARLRLQELVPEIFTGLKPQPQSQSESQSQSQPQPQSQSQGQLSQPLYEIQDQSLTSDYLRDVIAPSPPPNRFILLNLWRPIKPIRRDPLAVLDASSVLDADIVPVPLLYPGRKSETCVVRHDDAHRWYYKRAMRPDDLMLFKIFDSKVQGVARRAPHSAFLDPDSEEGLPPRESIELRAFAIFEDQPYEG